MNGRFVDSVGIAKVSNREKKQQPLTLRGLYSLRRIGKQTEYVAKPQGLT
jgi:hypothetical protein